MPRPPETPTRDRDSKARAREQIADHLQPALLHRVESESVVLRLYFCEAVMELAAHLRHHTKAATLATQHDVLRDVFKYLAFGERGRVEAHAGQDIFDISLDDDQLSIEVKTIVSVTTERVKNKAIAVVERSRVDRAWVFYFYKFGGPSPRPPCKYLLTWLDIDFMTDEDIPLEEQPITVVEDGHEAAAEKLGVKPPLLIPVDNIIRAEDLEREVEELKAEKAAELDEKDAEIRRLRAELKKREP